MHRPPGPWPLVPRCMAPKVSRVAVERLWGAAGWRGLWAAGGAGTGIWRRDLEEIVGEQPHCCLPEAPSLANRRPTGAKRLSTLFSNRYLTSLDQSLRNRHDRHESSGTLAIGKRPAESQLCPARASCGGIGRRYRDENIDGQGLPGASGLDSWPSLLIVRIISLRRPALLLL